MYYLIQKNIFQDPRYDEIFHVMDKLQLDYEQVTFKPESDDFDIQTNRKDIFVYGSVKLAKVATKYPWAPGSFYGGNHEFEQYSKGYGEHTINYDSYLCRLEDKIDWIKDTDLFIKPSEDAKVFTGKIFNESEWEDFVYNSLNDSRNERLTKATKVQVSKPFSLIKEVRVWIVDNQIVTSSYYRFHGDVEYEENVAEEGIEFAGKMVEIYKVADAYVMDIGLTYDGWKIIEVNCINSAGFYKGDVMKIVLALEHFYG